MLAVSEQDDKLGKRLFSEKKKNKTKDNMSYTGGRKKAGPKLSQVKQKEEEKLYRNYGGGFFFFFLAVN